MPRAFLRVGMAGAAMVALAAGCGSQHAAEKVASPSAAERTSAARHGASAPSHQQPAAAGSTCPKVIAANCVPGRHDAGGLPVICVGHGTVRIARSVTWAALARRLKKEEPNAERVFRKTGKLPYALTHPPTTIILHMLPGGRSRGICVYSGTNPALPLGNY